MLSRVSVQFPLFASKPQSLIVHIDLTQNLIMLIDNNNYNQPFTIELNHRFINVSNRNLMFPDGRSQLRDAPSESPNKVEVINRRNSTSYDNFFDLTGDLRMQLHQLLAGNSCQVALAMVECNAYCFDTVIDQLKNFCDYIYVGVL